jgi:hypothetical protein
MPGLTEVRETYQLDLAAEVLSSNGTIRLRALGTSMLPSIWPGDVLSIESNLAEQIVPGDLVLVARDGRFVVHRLVERRSSQWITRGDAMPQNDPPVADGQLLGKVFTIHRLRRAVVPNPRVAPLVRTVAWILRDWGLFRNIALRIHAFLQRRASLGTNGDFHPANGE